MERRTCRRVRCFMFSLVLAQSSCRGPFSDDDARGPLGVRWRNYEGLPGVRIRAEEGYVPAGFRIIVHIEVVAEADGVVPATTALSRTEMHQDVVVWIIWASVTMLQYNIYEINIQAQG